jgi:hypothetical protein
VAAALVLLDEDEPDDDEPDDEPDDDEPDDAGDAGVDDGVVELDEESLEDEDSVFFAAGDSALSAPTFFSAFSAPLPARESLR